MYEQLHQRRRCLDIVDGGGAEPDAAHVRTARYDATEIEITETTVTDHFKMKSAKRPGVTRALVVGALAPAGPGQAQSAVDKGRKLSFDRSKGNCLTCHVI